MNSPADTLAHLDAYLAACAQALAAGADPAAVLGHMRHVGAFAHAVLVETPALAVRMDRAVLDLDAAYQRVRRGDGWDGP